MSSRVSRFSRLALSAAVLCALSGAGSRVAHAQSPAQPSTPSPSKPVVAVDVAAGDPELDPASLRTAIGLELGDEAVAPDDARAAQAVGTVRVSIDRKAHALVVAYRGASGPITRTVDLPADRTTAERAAVLLAGNLARDEADELAKSLRRPESPAGPTPNPTTAVPPPPPPDPAEAEETRELDLLGQTLALHDRESHPRRVSSLALFWTGIGGLFASSGLVLASVAVGNDAMGTAGEYVGAAGAAVIAVSDLVRPGDFSGLHERYVSWREYLRPRQAREDLEALWAAEARREHHRRFVGGLMFTIFGGASVALGVASVSTEASGSNGNPAQIGPSIAWAALGAEVTTFGIYWLATKGPVESTLQEYERSSEHVVPARAEARLSLRPFLAPTRGGGMAGLGGEF